MVIKRCRGCLKKGKEIKFLKTKIKELEQGDLIGKLKYKINKLSECSLQLEMFTETVSGGRTIYRINQTCWDKGKQIAVTIGKSENFVEALRSAVEGRMDKQ